MFGFVGDAMHNVQQDEHYYSQSYVSKIKERSRELCLTAAKLSHEAERLIHLSQIVQGISKELMRDTMAKRVRKC